MSETTENNNSNSPQEEFGIDNSTVSKNAVNMQGGINKAFLVSVKSEAIGKGETKYDVLNFKFMDLDGIKTFTHTEFIPKGQATTKETELENYNKKKGNFNKRIKHIFEAFTKLPENSVLGGGKNWKEHFDKIAEQFNNFSDGKPIYQNIKDGKTFPIPVYIKNTYQTQGKGKGNLQFPQLPNFIERITPENANAPKSLVIYKKYDVVVQPDMTTTNGQVMGGTPGIHTGGSDDNMGF